MSISDLFHPNYYDIYCDTLFARQMFVSSARTMGYFYPASSIMVPPATVGATPTIVARATGSAGTINAASALHIVPGVTCDIYINLPQPAETQLATGEQRGYYLGTVQPTYVINTGAATSLTANLYKSMFTQGSAENNVSALTTGPVAMNVGVSANIQVTTVDPPNIYVDQNDTYTLKISIVSGLADIYFYGVQINYLYFFY